MYLKWCNMQYIADAENKIQILKSANIKNNYGL